VLVQCYKPWIGGDNAVHSRHWTGSWLWLSMTLPSLCLHHISQKLAQTCCRSC